jgi:hypothetical protein
MTRWACVAFVLGCGHPAAPAEPITTAPPRHDAGAGDAAAAKPLDEDLPRLATRSVALYQDLLKALTEAGADCAVATTKLNALVDDYADVIAANAKVLHAGRDRVKLLRAALEPHQDELDASAKAIVGSTTLATCHDDKPFAMAMDRLVGEP